MRNGDVVSGGCQAIMKVCIVSSNGGHLTEVRELKPVFEQYEYFYVINRPMPLPPDMEGKVDFIRHSERDLLFFVNLWEAFKILRRERPQVILSTGAGCVVPFALLGRLLFGTRVVYIETLTRLEVPSLTGRIMYYLADNFFYQTKGLRKFFPRAEYQGTLL